MFEEASYMAMAYSQMIFSPIIMAGVLLPIIIYIIARWRSYQEDGAPDPQLGIKVAISWFQITAYQILLMATFLLLFALIGDLPDGFGEPVVRIALGLSLPSLILFSVLTFALKNTNSQQRPAVHRMFSGVSLFQTGIVAFGAFTFGGVLLFQENVPTIASRLALSAVMVYGAAWVIQGITLLSEVTGYSTSAPSDKVAPSVEDV